MTFYKRVTGGLWIKMLLFYPLGFLATQRERYVLLTITKLMSHPLSFKAKGSIWTTFLFTRCSHHFVKLGYILSRLLHSESIIFILKNKQCDIVISNHSQLFCMCNELDKLTGTAYLMEESFLKITPPMYNNETCTLLEGKLQFLAYICISSEKDAAAK